MGGLRYKMCENSLFDRRDGEVMKENSFGQNIKDLMDARNLSERKLASKLDIPHKTLNEWISIGRIPRDPEQIKKLARFFEVSVHYLLFGEEDARTCVKGLLNKMDILDGVFQIKVTRMKLTDNLLKGGVP